MPKEQPEAQPEMKPGQNVFAKIEGKEAGPFYFVQVNDGKAILQGEKAHVVPVADLIRPA